MLNAKDSAIDIYMIDIVNPAQYFGAGWLEPLNAYVGKPADVMKPYLPVYLQSNVVDGKVAAMPGFADAMFMYYRKDLLDKYKHPRAQDLGRARRRVEEDPGRRGQPQSAGPVDPGRADRGRGVHVPAALLEPGQGVQRRRRQA